MKYLKRRAATVFAWVAGAVLVAACGDLPTTLPLDQPAGASGTTQPASADSWPSAADLGHCPYDLSEEATIDVMPLVAYLQLYPDWMTVNSISTGADLSSTDYALAQVSVSDALVGPARSEVLMRPNLVALAVDELGRGAELLVGVLSSEASDPYAGPMVSLRPNGEAAFIGLCGALSTTELVQYVEYLTSKGRSATPASAIVALVTNPQEMASLEAWTIGPPPTSWEEQDPDQRLLDPQETPADVLSSLPLVMVTIDIPDSWRSLPATICTKAPLGWNRCSSLELDDIGIEVDSYTVPGEDLEVWLLDSGANILEPLALIGTIPGSLLNSVAADSRPTVNVVISADVSDLTSLVGALDGGSVEFNATAGDG